MEIWIVEVATYMGEGYWADYPPMEFDSEAEANAYATVINMNSQMDGTEKVRRIYRKE